METKIPTDIAKTLPKILSGKLSQKDNKRLATWLHANPSAEAWLKETLQPDKLQADLNLLEEFHQARNWEKLQQSATHRSPRSRWIRQFMATAAMLCILFGASLVLMLLDKSNKQIDHTLLEHAVNPEHQEIQPAHQGAQLRMSNGKTVVLKMPMQIAQAGQLLDSNRHILANLPVERAVSKHILTVPKAQYYSFQFADGTKVWLNANSSLEFPSRFQDHQREVHLSGEAYFEVEPDAKRPFIVRTEHGNVRVLGTKFNVNAYSGRFISSLLEGSILMQTDQESTLLLPNQRAVWSLGNIQVQPWPIRKDIAWKEQLFLFQNDKLKDILLEVENWYGIQVQGLEQLTDLDSYSGEISRKLSLSKLLELLEFSSDFHFQLRGGILFIDRKTAF